MLKPLSISKACRRVSLSRRSVMRSLRRKPASFRAWSGLLTCEVNFLGCHHGSSSVGSGRSMAYRLASSGLNSHTGSCMMAMEVARRCRISSGMSSFDPKPEAARRPWAPPGHAAMTGEGLTLIRLGVFLSVSAATERPLSSKRPLPKGTSAAPVAALKAVLLCLMSPAMASALQPWRTGTEAIYPCKCACDQAIERSSDRAA
mmetsp:Transcript_56072/g.121259  ORF Transcript_56072/g.121259 Transcript_56072/m.121259 type:complete len:203 (-) Transcript_56072:129-737(-)